MDGFELEDENLTRMKFPEVKVEDKIELQNNEESGVGFDILPRFWAVCRHALTTLPSSHATADKAIGLRQGQGSRRVAP